MSCRFAPALSKIAGRFFLFLFFSCSLFSILLLFIGKFRRVRSGTKGSDKKKKKKKRRRRLPNRTDFACPGGKEQQQGRSESGSGWMATCCFLTGDLLVAHRTFDRSLKTWAF